MNYKKPTLLNRIAEFADNVKVGRIGFKGRAYVAQTVAQVRIGDIEKTIAALREEAADFSKRKDNQWYFGYGMKSMLDELERTR